MICGENGGVTQMGSKVFGDFITKNIKASHIFWKRNWKLAQQDPKSVK
jgi:hypothetical protein